MHTQVAEGLQGSRPGFQPRNRSRSLASHVPLQGRLEPVRRYLDPTRSRRTACPAPYTAIQITEMISTVPKYTIVIPVRCQWHLPVSNVIEAFRGF